MNLPYKTIVIDDEKLARNRLVRLLNQYENMFDIISEAENGAEGLLLIEKHKPDLIFLDIQMPGLNGFEMLGKLNHIPVIVFTTAFEEYAIKAFEQNSMDYLLKPIESERLELTIQKLRKLSTANTPVDAGKFLEFLEAVKPKQASITSIPVKKGDRIFIVKLDEIAFFEAKDKYVFIHTDDGTEHLVDFTLAHLEEKLPANFLRAHRAFIVNKNKIKEVQKYFDGKFVLILNDKSGAKIITGSSYSKEVRALIEM